MFKLSTLGERIREIRKQRKMTLDALAGDQMTKAMMSYIENNKANPSMESLSYIAERLGVKVSELLEDINPQEVREVLGTVEKIFAEGNYKQIINIAEPYVDRLDQGYESARLLELYGRSLYYEKKVHWPDMMDKASALYDQLNLTSRLAAIGIFQSIVKFKKREYETSLAILLEERSKIEKRNGLIEPLIRLDFDYWASLLHFAVGNSEEAVRIMNEGIEFSKEQQLFYRIAHLYQLAIVNAMMNKDVSSISYYEKKILHYGEFADDRDAIPFIRYVKIHYLTSYEKKFGEALELLKEHHDEYGFDESNTSYSFIEEKGKALYGLGRYEEALACFDQVKIPDYANHPFDLSILYEKDAFAALCHVALGNQQEAKRLIQIAMENISAMPRTPYKEFVTDIYNNIM